MSKFIDLTGQTFGYWKVLYLTSTTTNRSSIWHCECTLCHREYDVAQHSLTSNRSTKCRSCATHLSRSGKFANDPIQIIFKGMKQRCYNPNAISYKNYGAKGITICDEWLNNPDSFYEWAYQNGYQKGMSIERESLDKGYSPDNCSFIPLGEQAKNRSICHIITIDGITQCLADWCKHFNILPCTVMARVKKGMSFEDALKTPVKV